MVTLDNCLKANVVWSVLMVLAIGSLAITSFPSAWAAVFGVALGFAAASFAALRHQAWALGVVIGGALAMALRWTPMVLLNAWAFAQGDPRYGDSPGTILVVVIYAVLFAIPGCLLVFGYAMHGRAILGLIRSRKNERTA